MKDRFSRRMLKTSIEFVSNFYSLSDSLCGLVLRIPGYRSRGPGSIPGATRFSLRHYATSRKVAESSLDESDIFN
jgi:hypothetical protein